jgi:hypothetical protein
MNSAKILQDLVKVFEGKSLDSFTRPLTLKGKKGKKERRRLIKESEVWETATREISRALASAKPSKRAEPGSVIAKYEGDPLTTVDKFYMREVSQLTGVRDSQVKLIILLLSRGETRREISEAVGISMKKLRKVISVFRLDY